MPRGGGVCSSFYVLFWYGESDEKDGKEEEEKIMKERGGGGAEVLKMGDKREFNLASEVCHLRFNFIYACVFLSWIYLVQGV